MRRFRIAVLVLAGALLPVAGLQAAYPEKPIRLVVPWAPGGSADVLARLVANRLNTAIGQPVVVDNKPGAAGNLGSDMVAKSKPDGYTLLLGLMNTHVANQGLYKNMPFHGINDFTPICMLGFVTTTMAVHPSVPAGNVREFIAHAKANPGKVAYASAGHGASTHLNAAVFASMAGITMLHVPYKGGAPAVQDTVAGTTQVVFSAANLTMPQAAAGKLKLLAVTEGRRASILPNVPTIGESLPGYEMPTWYGVFGPAGMPEELTKMLNAEINRIMNSPDVRATLGALGMEAANETPEQFRATMRKDAEFYTKLLREMNIEPE